MDVIIKLLVAFACICLAIGIYLASRYAKNYLDGLASIMIHRKQEEAMLPMSELTKTWTEGGTVIRDISIKTVAETSKTAMANIEHLLQLSEEHDQYINKEVKDEVTTNKYR